MMVWIVNPFDNLPMEGNRPQRYWLMAQAFVRAGHQVVYWTSDFSHATKQKRLSLKSEGEKGIEVIQLPTLPYAKNICLSRVKSHRQLARDFERQAMARTDIPGLVIASMPPLGLCAAAMRVAKAKKAKSICDIQDAWPETFERILPRWVWSVLGLRGLAKRIYTGADAIAAVSQRYLELAKQYGSVAPMQLAGHAIDFEGPVAAKPLATPLRLVYIGNMSLSYDLATVIESVKGMSGVTLDIAGNGPDRARLGALAKEDATNVRFHGYLNEAELRELLHNCDVGLIPMFPESCVGVPGKLADYAAAGLRVIESLGGECQELVARFGAGVHYVAGDRESFRSALAQVSSLADEKFDCERFAETFSAHKVMDAFVAWAV